MGEFVQQIIDWAHNSKSTFGSTASTEIAKKGGLRKAPARLFNAEGPQGQIYRVYADLDVTTPGMVGTPILKSVRVDPQMVGSDPYLYLNVGGVVDVFSDPLSFTVDTVANTAGNTDSTFWFSFDIRDAYFDVPQWEFRHFTVTAEVTLTYTSKKRVTFDGEEVELVSVPEFEDPSHPMFAPLKMVSEHSDYYGGISLLQQAEETVFGAVEMEIQGSEAGEDDSSTGADDAADEQYITESSMGIEMLVAVLGGVILFFGLCILMVVAVRRRNNKDQKKCTVPITLEAVQISSRPTTSQYTNSSTWNLGADTA